MTKPLEDKRVLITGGTGSLGQAVVRRLLTGEMGHPAKITIFSRDEAKQYYMRLGYLNREVATDDITYRNFQQWLSFRIGDVRDYPSLLPAVREADVIIQAAALKQVPTCEYFPTQAVATNINGAINLVRAIREHDTTVETVVAISTDKAAKPINVMGMTKAVMERIMIEANMNNPHTRFTCVRYGNVLASRGSVVPLFIQQVKQGGPVTVTEEAMTRFLLTLDQAVDTIFAAIRTAAPGEVLVPRAPSALMMDVARVVIGERDIPIEIVGIRPGEKTHEIMISEEESRRTIQRGNYYAIRPMLPELLGDDDFEPALTDEYSSQQVTLDQAGLRELLAEYLESPSGVLA